MKLREHPLMTRRSGVSSWPPVWTTANGARDAEPAGEVGALERVIMHDALERVIMHDLFDNKVFVFIRRNDARYTGLLQFDDPSSPTASTIS